MTELTPANENTWYVLMTLYGEQEGDEVDWELAEENRRVWNAWSCQGLSDDERARVCASSEVDIVETQGWGEIEAKMKKQHRAAMKKRNGDGFSYPGFPDFKEIVKLSEIAFSNTVVLEEAIFTQDAYFVSATFTQDAYFVSATFTQDAYFVSATFTQAAHFNSATFTQAAHFNSATFTQDAYFVSATFTQAAHFRSATFTQAAYFESATFTQAAHFRSATFTQAAYFDSATFTQAAYFVSATFTQDADFESATFTQAANFESATFTQDAYFVSATFTQAAYFISATFDGPAKFVDAHFGVRDGEGTCVPDFTEVTFAKLVSFRKADFVTHYPVLEGAAFAAKVVLTANNAFWPPMERVLLDEVEEDAEHIPTKEVAKESCSTLRHEIGRQGLPEEEHFFFRREMQFAGQIGPWWRRLPYRVFGAVSNYGESIAAPIVLLIGLWLIPALIYLPYFAWIGTMGDSPWTGLQGFALSFSNIFTFFGFQRLYFDLDLVRALPAVLKLMGALQTVLALPLLFFLGLGLRKRFRLR